MDLVTAAPRAVWSSGAGRLLFGGSRNDQRGFAIHPRPYLLLEDGSAHELLLETHPRWTDDGWIRGEFLLPVIAPGDHFTARFGFIQPQGPPQTNGVTITVVCEGRTVAGLAKRYTGRLDELSVDLSRFAGGGRVVAVEVGADGDSTQDWLVWTRMTVGRA